MNKRNEQYLTFAVDFLMVNLAYAAFYWIRIKSGWLEYVIEPEFWLPMFAVNFYWVAYFFLFGLYRSWYQHSRLDEILTVFRATALGILFLFFLIFVDDQAIGAQTNSRLLIVVYWGTLSCSVVVGRMGLRFVERKFLQSGIGARNTIIVGWSENAFGLCDTVLKFPALGYKMVGFVRPSSKSQERQWSRRHSYRQLPVLGFVKEIPELLEKHEIQEVLIGLDSTEHDQLLEIIKYCDGRDVGMKILPDMYDIVSGQARISSIYGSPLMEVRPQLMKPWEETLKRLLDILVSLSIIVVGLPLWLLIALFIKLDSKGPQFYKQERVGRNGRVFKMFKFRSMKIDAERQSGPVWAGRNDPRVTRAGKILRRAHLDEVPQFLNVLLGDMSLVGPRPERPYFVEKLTKDIPLYKRRLKVRPGITGWAQIKYKYDESVDDVRTKLKYDLFYIENLSWRLDLKILFNTLYVTIVGKGHT